MNIFAIGDLHLPGGDTKPMDVFGSHWENHFERISRDWCARVGGEDVVLLPGDLSWAMQLEAALADLRLIGALPGKKLILRGNHDYWWSSLTQLRARLPEGMFAIQNDACEVGGVVFCALITWIATRGMGGAVRVFSRIMPLLVILSLVVVAAALAMFGRNGIQFVPAATRNPVVNHWLLAAVTFVSYNLLCALGTLSSLGTMARSDRDIRVGAALGGVILLVISLGINGAMAALPASTSAELPMLYLAQQLSPVLEGVYALVILLGMFGASMSVFVPVPQYLFRFRRLEGHPVLVPVVLSVGAFFLSQVGFSDLIGTLFPVFGFLGFVFIGGILCNAWRALRKKSQAEEVTVTGGGHGTNQ